MRFIEVITKDNDRWDLIAWRCYGDASRIEPILPANPDIPIRSVLPAGLRVLVPVLAAPSDEAALPPWKRSQGGSE